MSSTTLPLFLQLLADRKLAPGAALLVLEAGSGDALPNCRVL